jgi:hypothetical protein
MKMRTYVYTLMLVLTLTANASAQQVCEEVPTGWQCYFVDGPTKPWDVRTGPVEDYGQVFLGPVPGAAGGFQAYLSIVSPTRDQSAWVLVWPDGGVLVVLRVRLQAGVRRTALLNDVPGVRGFNAASVRVIFERDAVVGLALHGESVIVLH